MKVTTKALVGFAAFALAGVSSTERAAADVFETSAQLQTGYSGGQGLSGEVQDSAFAAGATGYTYGARAGFRIALFEGWIEHNQFLGGDGLLGTWTQFMAGPRVEVGFGGARVGAKLEGGEIVGAYPRYFGTLGVGVGYGIGTGQQVEPPRSNTQATDTGVVAQARAGLGFRIDEMYSLRLTVPIEGGYLFKGGDGHDASEQDSDYRSVRAAALLGFRMRLGF